MRVSSAFAPRIAAYHALCRPADPVVLRRQWGVLADLAGKVLHAGEEWVDFDWAERGTELHVRFGDAGMRRVSRYVIFTLDDEGNVLFADGRHVLRGRGRVAADGSVWFTDTQPVPGSDESGAIYTAVAGGLDRQRYATRGNDTELQPAVHYAPLEPTRRVGLVSLCA